MNSSFTIKPADQHPELLEELATTFKQYWGEAVPIVHSSPHIPPTLIAVSESNWVGALSFIEAPSPHPNHDPAIWVNAVYVKPDHRRRGWAQQLIQAAEIYAAAIDTHVLFVFTHLPSLYNTLGWDIVRENEGEVVLTKQLTPAP